MRPSAPPEARAHEVSDHESVTPTNVYNTHPQDATQDKILVGAWDAGFCSCCDFLVPNLCMAWCCPWVTVAQITTRLGLYPFAKTLLLVLAIHVLAWQALAAGYATMDGSRHHRVIETSKLGGMNYLLTPALSAWQTYYSLWFVLGQLLLVAYGLILWRLRMQVRARFLIPGDGCQDLCAGVLCSCCAIAQLATHVKSYKPGSCDFRACTETLPGYP